MGCSHSVGERGASRVFGANDLHVGRDGDVDLTSRSMDVLQPKYIDFIRRDKMHVARRLHLSANKLYALGKEMTLLPDIEELYIDGNRFERLPAVLSSMERLRLVNASMNPLGTHPHALDVLPHVENLTDVVLRDCSLTTIPATLQRCHSLRVLDLSDNLHLRLSEEQFTGLPTLRTLRVANCGLTKEIPTCIKDITTLHALDISANFFNFDDSDFFGSNLPQTLRELHLCAMHLKAVPQVVSKLRKLDFLDLAENALETLDVLAGRLVRKLLPGSALHNGVVTSVAETNDDTVSGHSQTNTRVSISQVSRAGSIAHVSQRIPLTRLSLRACDLHTLPKYFHKLTNLVDIDLSENEHLCDPNMTLFSLSNLEVLNVVGCPFAEERECAHNEWFDIANLRKLRTINWEVWKGEYNMNPYCTKVPLEICGLKLEYINGIKLRPRLFVGDTVQTIINLLLDGYFKVDLALHDDLVYGYAEAAANYNSVIVPPADVMVIHYAHMTQDPISYRNDCEAICGQVISCNYHLFFLEQKLRPHAVKEALSGSRRVWNMMVRTIQKDLFWLRYDFWEQQAKKGTLVTPAAHEENVVGNLNKCKADVNNNNHNHNNNNNNNSAAGDILSVDFSAPSAGLTPTSPAAPSAAPSAAPPAAPPCDSAEIGDLCNVDSVGDLCSVLDHSITSHFTEQGPERFIFSLKKFFTVNKRFLKSEIFVDGLHIDWTRYVKYLALYAHIQRLKQPEEYGRFLVQRENVETLNNSIVSPDAYLPRPADINGSVPIAPQRRVTGFSRRSGLGVPLGNNNNSNNAGHGLHEGMKPMQGESSTLARNNDNGNRRQVQPMLASEPVPTVAISLLLHSHRTLHAKYYQTLALLGIENIDIHWEETAESMEATMREWMTLYNEQYVKHLDSLLPFFDASQPLQRGRKEGKDETSRESTHSTTPPKRPGSKRLTRGNRHVTLCFAVGDNEIF